MTFKSIGTPRQGLLAPATRAYIQFATNVPHAAFDGLNGMVHLRHTRFAISPFSRIFPYLGDLCIPRKY